MPRLLLIGEPGDTRALLPLLPDGDYAVTLAPDLQTAADLLRAPAPPSLVMVVLSNSQPGLPPALAGEGRAGRWLAWNRADQASLAAAAYEQGALAVLPGAVTPEGLRTTLRTAFARLAEPAAPPRRRAHGVAQHARGERLYLSDDDVLIVEQGLVATEVLHEDGTEVLIGLSGPGDLLLGHPHDSCCLHLRAHTDVRVVVQSWAHAATTPQFTERLRTRLWRAEAWAAVLARPHLPDQLVGLLSVLAEQFGRPSGDALLVDVRLTHAQLAAALGTTRATVTRLIGRLRRARVLDTTGDGHDERFLLRLVERYRHS